ncbi:ABC transporter substrate-binding protein [Undibacter mobilis]|uniref:ABC transporter substrate-binding protein n=1 Tax=Undibacter mobilis TaxID=2292256 RepID=UPI00143D970A|nr:ABC transporter substrate-binding protein [Undibacter mobilis]
MAAILFVFALAPAVAQERVTVAVTRSSANGALFLAAARGYFKAEGIELDMTAYASDADVVKAMAAGSTDIALANWSIETVKLASQGVFKAVAAQAREKDGYEGNEMVVSAAAYDRGVRKLDQLLSGVVVVDAVGSTLHYQLEQARTAKGASMVGFTLRFAGSPKAAAAAITEGRADIAMLPMVEARNLLATNQAKLVAWCSQFSTSELGALFASQAMLSGRRAVSEKFLRAYRRGAADYHAAFLRLDRYSKRVSNAVSQEAAKILAYYVYPRARRDEGLAAAEGEVHYMDAQARVDTADLSRRVAWYQAQGLLDKTVNAQNLVDLNFK